jgi:adenosylcobinamide kinase/adenosylcobinamide-phosphate guanylyltransferase
MIELILGGARSGKSRFAEQRMLDNGKRRVYLATAQAMDDEMAARIAVHRSRRTSGWETVEEPLHLAAALGSIDDAGCCILVDCLTLWLSNLLHADDPDNWQREKDRLLEVLPDMAADIYLVSNEVGAGIVPMGALSRRFVDEAGWLHQDLARISDVVTLVVAGLPQQIKPQHRG